MRSAALRSAIPILLALWSGSLASRPGHAQIALSGRIDLPGGGPAAGVEVELVPLTTTFDFGVLVLEGRHRPKAAARATTRNDGTFSLEAPSAGMWRLLARTPGYRPMEQRFHPLFQDQLLPTLELIEETSVKVLVKDPAGAPIPGARVMAGPPPAEGGSGLSRSRDAWRPLWRQTFADATGVAYLGRGPQEKLEIFAFASGYLEGEAAAVDTGQVTLNLKLATLLPLRITGPQGHPLPGALARLGDRHWPIGQADAEGLLSLPMPAEGEDRVWVFTAGGGSAEQHLESASWLPDEPQTIVVNPTTRRSGRVVDKQSGAGLAGAFAWASGRPADFVLTDASGGYSLPSPANKDTWIWAAARAFSKRPRRRARARRTRPP